MISIYPTPGRHARVNLFIPQNIHNFSMISPHVIRSTWSPIIYKDNTRKQANFLKSVIVALDFDDGEMSLAEAVDNYFCDMRHIIGTTKSHQKEKNGVVCDRFRVVLQLERAVDSARHYRYIMKQMLNKYPIDRAALDAARLFYPCDEVVSVSDGYLVEVQDVPERFESYKKRVEPFRGTKIVPSDVSYRLNRVPKKGERNAYFFGIACNLMSCGFDVDETKYLVFNSKAIKPHNDDAACLAGINRTITQLYLRNQKT